MGVSGNGGNSLSSVRCFGINVGLFMVDIMVAVCFVAADASGGGGGGGGGGCDDGRDGSDDSDGCGGRSLSLVSFFFLWFVCKIENTYEKHIF